MHYTIVYLKILKFKIEKKTLKYSRKWVFESC